MSEFPVVIEENPKFPVAVSYLTMLSLSPRVIEIADYFLG